MARNCKHVELKCSQLETCRIKGIAICMETCVINGLAFENPQNERAGKWTPADFMGSHFRENKGRAIRNPRN